MFHLHATFIPLFLLFLSPSCCLQGISYPYPCSHGNKSLSFSCAATFYNMEVTLFYLTTFFPLFISLSMIVENFQCVCSDSICVSTVEKQNKQKNHNWMNSGLLSFPDILWTLLSYTWLSERGKNYYYLKHYPPAYPWQDHHELNWNHNF